MRSIFYSVAAAVLILPSVPVQGRDLVTLNPSSPWNVHYADDYCKLGREFGEGHRKVVLILEQNSPGDRFIFKLAGDTIRPLQRDETMFGAKVTFGPNENANEQQLFAGKIGGIPSLIGHGTMKIAPVADAGERTAGAAAPGDSEVDEPIGSARERAVRWVELRDVLRFDLHLNTGPLDRAFEALRTCGWDTIASWGLDAEKHKMLLRKPTALNGQHVQISWKDYPNLLVQEGQQGIVHARVIVSAQGETESCVAQNISGDPMFGDVVCKKMKMLRWSPALDATGQPIRSYVHQTVTFRLE